MYLYDHYLGFSFAVVVIVTFVVEVDYRAIYHSLALKRENLPES